MEANLAKRFQISGVRGTQGQLGGFWSGGAHPPTTTF